MHKPQPATAGTGIYYLAEGQDLDQTVIKEYKRRAGYSLGAPEVDSSTLSCVRFLG